MEQVSGILSQCDSSWPLLRKMSTIIERLLFPKEVHYKNIHVIKISSVTFMHGRSNIKRKYYKCRSLLERKILNAIVVARNTI